MNGWNNRETWQATLWGYSEIDSDELRRIMEDEDLSKEEKIERIAEALQDQFDDSFRTYTSALNGTIFSDFVVGAAQLINWLEIADSVYSDYE